jgi:hypothetical protein
MPVLPYRVAQSTATTGTGTLTLQPAAASMRGFRDGFGTAAVPVFYTIAWATGFEAGLGTFDGEAPGTLTRNTVLARQSGASGLANLPAGTKDVFAVLASGQRAQQQVTGSASLTIADLGNLVIFTGSGPAVLALPAATSVAPGTGYLIRHAGSGILTLDPASSGTIDGATTQILFAGDACEAISTGSAWVTAGLPTGWRRIERKAVSTVSQVVFELPPGPTQYRVETPFFGVSAAGVSLIFRSSADGGASYFDAAGAYSYGWLFSSAAGAQSGFDSAGFVNLTNNLAIGNPGNLSIDIYPGDAARPLTVRAAGGVCSQTPPEWRAVQAYGARTANGRCDTVKFQPSAGTVTGEFALLGLAP